MRASRRISQVTMALLCILSRQKALAFSYVVRTPLSRTMTRHSVPSCAFTKPRPPSLQHKLYLLTTGSAGSSSNGDDDDSHLTLRDRLRQITGFSLTAFRATLRGITGISLTALYASAVATTSSFVRNTMKVILSVFPSWFRYFLQPFLVMYYVPLFMIRATLGPSQKERRAGHEHLVESWKKAVSAAEEAQHGGYWPVHVNDDGKIVAVLPPDPDSEDSDVDIAGGVADSVEMTMNDEEETKE